MINCDGSGLALIYPDIGWGDWSLSPGGDRILLASLFNIVDTSYAELYLMNTDGTGLVKLAAPPGWYATPRISPGLDQIAFGRGSGLGIIDSDGTNLRLISPPTGAFCNYPMFVSQNELLYDEKDSSNLSLDHWNLLNTATGEVREVGTVSMTHAPLGRVISRSNFIISDMDTVKVFDVFTPAVTRLGPGWGANFSANGSEVVAYGDSTPYVMDSMGGNRHAIFTATDPGRAIMEAEFSPDNQYMVFWTYWATN